MVAKAAGFYLDLGLGGLFGVGATRIHVIDIKEERLAVARAVGADSTWNDTKSSLTAAIQQGNTCYFSAAAILNRPQEV